MEIKITDGGRSRYYDGRNVGDCVVRAIAIATGQDYKQTYDDLARGMKKISGTRSARNGVSRKVYQPYLEARGFEWVPVMKFGTGCKMRANERELPDGTLVLRLTKHLTACIDKVIHDTYDPTRGGTRCVYGYFIKK